MITTVPPWVVLPPLTTLFSHAEKPQTPEHDPLGMSVPREGQVAGSNLLPSSTLLGSSRFLQLLQGTAEEKRKHHFPLQTKTNTLRAADST